MLKAVDCMDAPLGTCSFVLPGNTLHSSENPSAHAYLNSVASQGGGPSKPPALLLGHHEQLGQALLHDPGKALVVQAYQRVVHTLEH